ncbi:MULTISPECIES: hypothetical protein [Streptomyces]|uniref:hypothetical protein n=1 Tax=Streptomyces TaxID=1883 RepID=UPI0031D08A8B
MLQTLQPLPHGGPEGRVGLGPQAVAGAFPADAVLTAVITTYFEDRIAAAEKEVEEARAALAAEAKVEQRQTERGAFA